MKNDAPPSLDKYLQLFQATDKLEVLIIEWRPPQSAPFTTIDIAIRNLANLFKTTIHEILSCSPWSGVSRFKAFCVLKQVTEYFL